MNDFLRRPMISLGTLAAILAFVLTASVGITHYFVSSLYEMEITRLRDELGSIKKTHGIVSDSKPTPVPIRAPGADEKNGFYVGFLSRMRYGSESIRVALLAVAKERNIDVEIPRTESEEFLKAEQELAVRMESLGIKLDTPLDLHKITDPDSIKKHIAHIFEQISLIIRINHDKRVYDAYHLGSILGDTKGEWGQVYG